MTEVSSIRQPYEVSSVVFSREVLLVKEGETTHVLPLPRPFVFVKSVLRLLHPFPVQGPPGYSIVPRTQNRMVVLETTPNSFPVAPFLNANSIKCDRQPTSYLNSPNLLSVSLDSPPASNPLHQTPFLISPSKS